MSPEFRTFSRLVLFASGIQSSSCCAPAPPSVPSPGVAGGAPKRISKRHDGPTESGQSGHADERLAVADATGSKRWGTDETGRAAVGSDGQIEHDALPVAIRTESLAPSPEVSTVRRTDRSWFFSTFFSPLQRKTSADTTITRRRTFGQECPGTRRSTGDDERLVVHHRTVDRRRRSRRYFLLLASHGPQHVFNEIKRLLCEIFNEVCIPDLRSNVNVERILTLRRQVERAENRIEKLSKKI